MVMKKKNVRKGKDSFVKSELETLEKYEVKLEEHHLVNSLHDGKERLAMTQHKVLKINNLGLLCLCTLLNTGEAVLRARCC